MQQQNKKPLRNCPLALRCSLHSDGCVLASDPDHQHHGQNYQRSEPAEGRLTPRHNDERRKQWAERAADLSSNLKDSLREALLIAGSIPSHMGCLVEEVVRVFVASSIYES